MDADGRATAVFSSEEWEPKAGGLAGGSYLGVDSDLVTSVE